MNELRLAAQFTDVVFFSLSRLANVTGSVISFFYSRHP
jgi:hypothetical protein